jgi:hypothetical protein
MNTIAYAYRDTPPDLSLPVLAPENAPSLGCHICCSQCNRAAMRCSSNFEALGLALSQGWQIRLKKDCVIPAGQLIHAKDFFGLEDAEISI